MENPKWPEPQIVVMGASTEESEDAPAEDEAPDLSLGCIEREVRSVPFKRVPLWQLSQTFLKDHTEEPNSQVSSNSLRYLDSFKIALKYYQSIEKFIFFIYFQVPSTM